MARWMVAGGDESRSTPRCHGLRGATASEASRPPICRGLRRLHLAEPVQVAAAHGKDLRTALQMKIGGLVVTETVFTLNGLGRFMVDAIAHRDIPVVQTLVLFIAFSFVFVNLLVDLLYAWFDPRISYR